MGELLYIREQGIQRMAVSVASWGEVQVRRETEKVS
jgi:hypothetical protein